MKITIDTSTILTKREKYILLGLINGLTPEDLAHQYDCHVERIRLMITKIVGKLDLESGE